MTEIVFQVLAEGGSLTIERTRNRNGEKFIYLHNEFDPGDEGLDINEEVGYDSFEQPFQLINSKYPWFKLHLETVHADYRNYVLDELLKVLKDQGIAPVDLHSRSILEEALKVKLVFGKTPIRTGMQNIKVSNLMKLTEYDYQEYTVESGKAARIQGKYEIWTEEQKFPYDNVIVNERYCLETIGKLEITGNTILIKNEFEQIEYAFSSDKFFVSTTPLYSDSKSWFYRNV